MDYLTLHQMQLEYMDTPVEWDVSVIVDSYTQLPVKIFSQKTCKMPIKLLEHFVGRHLLKVPLGLASCIFFCVFLEVLVSTNSSILID